MTEIRLQWWREAILDARQGRPRAQPVAIALAQILSRCPIDSSDLEALVDARQPEIASFPFATLDQMESHARAISANLMSLAARLLGAEGGEDVLLREAGIAYGLTGMLRSAPFHLTRGRLFLPLDALAAAGLSFAPS